MSSRSIRQIPVAFFRLRLTNVPIWCVLPLLAQLLSHMLRIGIKNFWAAPPEALRRPNSVGHVGTCNDLTKGEEYWWVFINFFFLSIPGPEILCNWGVGNVRIL